jgi:hypothetical protein
MAKKNSILSHIRSLLSGKRPVAPKLKEPGWAPGHRGVAAGNWREREEKRDRGEEMFTQAERSHWQAMGDDEVTAFLEEGRPIHVHSSNVLWIQFIKDTNKLIIGYKSKGQRAGGVYEYSQVRPDEARFFIQTGSKGSAVWDKLRIRGTLRGHQKPYKRLS